MAIRIRNLSFVLATLFLLHPHSRGQSEEASLLHLKFYVASGARIRNVRFGMYDESGIFTGSNPTGFRTSGRSLQYEYQGPNPIVFFEEETAPTEADPEAVRQTPVARASLAEDAKKLLFFFTPNPDFPESGLKYNLIGIDIRKEVVPAGHITIFNTMPITFRGAVGKSKNRENGKTLNVLPGTNPPIDIQPRAQVLLVLESETEGFLRVYENTIDCGENERVLLILFPPRFPGSLNVGGRLISFPLQAEASEEK